METIYVNFRMPSEIMFSEEKFKFKIEGEK